jgi:hypothetical protein
MSDSLRADLIAFSLVLSFLLSIVFIFVSLNFAYLFFGGSVCISLILATELTYNKKTLEIKDERYILKNHITKPHEIISKEFLRVLNNKGCSSISNSIKNIQKESGIADFWSIKEEFEYCLEKNYDADLIIYGDVVFRGNCLRKVFDYFKYNLWINEGGDADFNGKLNKKHIIYGERITKNMQCFAALSAWQNFLWQWSINNIDIQRFPKGDFSINLTEGDFLCYKYLKNY